MTNGSASVLAPTAENGLAGAGFQLAEVPNALASPTKITSIAFNDDAASNQFDGGSFNISSVTPTVAQVGESNFLSTPFTGVQLGNNPPLAVASGVTQTPSNGAVFLGTVTLTVGNSPGITVFDLGAGVVIFAGLTVTNADTFDLDQSSTAAINQGAPAFTGVNGTLTTISIGFTPEPASVGFITLLSAVGLLKRRRENNAIVSPARGL